MYQFRNYRNKSQAWKYFELRHNTYFCRSDGCTNSYAESTPLIAHLKNNHEIDLIVGGEEAQSDESQDEQSTYVKETNNIKGAKFNETKQNQLFDLFVKFVVQDSQAFNIADRAPFLRFIRALEPRYVVLNCSV